MWVATIVWLCQINFFAIETYWHPQISLYKLGMIILIKMVRLHFFKVVNQKF